MSNGCVGETFSKMPDNFYVDVDKVKSNKLKAKSTYVENNKIELITNKDEIRQYSNERLYEFEKKLREGFKLKLEDPKFIQAGKGGQMARKYTIGMIIQEVLGRKGDSKIDGGYYQMYSRVVAYYSSSIAKSIGVPEKQRSVNRSAYVLSLGRIRRKVPYSLRLRYEYFIDKGVKPTSYNMHLPKDDLKPGHARNKKFEAKKQMISKKAKEDYEKGKRQQDFR